MESNISHDPSSILGGIAGFLRRCLFYILSFGPLPTHVAFIMDGNRRFTRSHKMEPGAGHRAGFLALMSALQYCFEMGIGYVTVYAFSIDNFKREPEEVERMMNLMLEKIESLLKEESLVTEYGVRVNFWGNLQLLSEPVRLAAEKAMAATSKNTGPVLSVCVAYTSTDEIIHAVQESCKKKLNIAKEDVEEHLYSASCPDPDIVIRTSGETRLSNFLLWQTTFSHLQNPSVLWPKFSLRHLVWSILEYQRAQPYLEKRRRFTH
uniref:Alkyl transferase n=1 Tax=Anthurium amnicola TaxID=1678845 RepID=A0A1D1YZU1_9ARAE